MHFKLIHVTCKRNRGRIEWVRGYKCNGNDIRYPSCNSQHSLRFPNRSTCQGISHLLNNPKVQHPAHKSQPLVRIFNQMNSLHTFPHDSPTLVNGTNILRKANTSLPGQDISWILRNPKLDHRNLTTAYHCSIFTITLIQSATTYSIFLNPFKYYPPIPV